MIFILKNKFSKELILSLFIFFTVLLFTYFFKKWDFDFGDYKYQIDNILEKGFLYKDAQLIDRYPPLTSLVYGYFFRIFGVSKFSFLLLHTILNLIIYKLTIRISNFYLGNHVQKLSYYLSLLVLINPFILSFTIRGVNSELLYIVLSLISFYCIISYNNDEKWYKIFVAFFCMCLLLLTRVQGLVFILAILISFYRIIFSNNRTRNIILLITSMIPLLIWQSQIKLINHSNAFLSSGGLNSVRDGFSFNYKKMRNHLELPELVDSFCNEFNRKFYTYTENNLGLSEIEFILKKIKDEPYTMVNVYCFKFIRTFYGVDSQNHIAELVNKVLISLMFLIFLYMFLKRKYFSELAKFSLLYFLLSSILSTLVLSILRYQVIVVPFILIYLNLGIINFFGQKISK